MDRTVGSARIAERLALLVTGGAIWLLLAALPALADGGPHVASINNGSLGLNADSCAGCHRAHTAQGPYLLNAADEEALCLTCHGTAGVGATTDVMTGLQYEIALPPGSAGQGTDPSVLLGALRGGGFDQARLDPTSVARQADPAGSGVEFLTKVPVGAAGDVTSAHLDLDDGDGVVASGMAWGNGANASGPGPAVVMGCASCHNPHGNGMYRILNPIPNPTVVAGLFAPIGAPGALVTDVPLINPATGTSDTKNYTVLQVRGTTNVDVSYLLYASQVQAAAAAGTFRVVAGIASSDATTNAITTTSPHGFAAGNSVTVAGHDASPSVNGTRTVAAVTATTFTLYASGASGPIFDITTGGGAAGTVTKNTGAIAGNYGPAGGDYFHRYVPWNGTSAFNRSSDAPNGKTTFSVQMTDWCIACHTRYYNATDAFTPRSDGVTEDPIFRYQHQTVSDGAVCLTCHVSHGSNVATTGSYSQTMPFPDGSLRYIPSTTTIVPDSRLLKFIDRGTCQACHDPTGTVRDPGDPGYYTGPIPAPGVP